ncbi:MAG: hypothetical protein K0M66_08425, partial [Thiobacillus sp.]|nr:hypothetical protein [Thiobacillus sp.]
MRRTHWYDLFLPTEWHRNSVLPWRRTVLDGVDPRYGSGCGDDAVGREKIGSLPIARRGGGGGGG